MTKKKKRSNKALENLCVECGLYKPTKDFSISNGYVNSYCKPCNSARTAEALYARHAAYVEHWINEGYVLADEREYAMMLLSSAQNRWYACRTKNKDSIYYDIKCDYPHYYDFADLLVQHEEFWQNYKNIGAIYIASGRIDGLKPTIDRLNSLDDYTLDNIQALPSKENTRRATEKPCKALILKNEKVIGGFAFNSRTDFNKKLSKYCPVSAVAALKLDTLELQCIGDMYILLQSNSFDLSTLDDIDDIEAKYELIINFKRNYIDIDTQQLIKQEHLYTITKGIRNLIIK